MPDVQKTVTDLNAGWYNVVTKALKIQDPTFLLAQGTLGLQTADSSGLFLMSDAVPPSAAVAYFDAGGMRRRSAAYAMLLKGLKPEVSTDLPDVLGDQYAAWYAYLKGYDWDAAGAVTTQLQLFERWANRNLDPGKTSQAIAAFKQGLDCPLGKAIDAVNDPGNKQEFLTPAKQKYSLYPYAATADAAVKAVNAGGSADINFSSESMDTSLEHTTVQGSASGFYDIFSGGASGSFEKLNQKAAASGWSIKGRIGKFATLVTRPSGAWYDSAEVTRAVSAKNDNKIWDPNANVGDWGSFFGQPNGSLARNITQLVLVSDYDITVTSHAQYSSEDKTVIQTKAEFGVWPFFSASASATHVKDVTVNAKAELEVHYKLNAGLIEIWGVTTENAAA